MNFKTRFKACNRILKSKKVLINLRSKIAQSLTVVMLIGC